MRPIVWTIAGSDSGGGAGIQADQKVFEALGTHACTVITAITAQNATQVSAVEALSPRMVFEQLEALKKEFPPLAIKTGMLPTANVVSEVAKFVARTEATVVCDPVLATSSGYRLAETEVVIALRELFLPHIDLLTPNLYEAQTLVGTPATTEEEIEKIAHTIVGWGPKSVLIKGGHTTGTHAHLSADYWTDGKVSCWLSNRRLSRVNTHGTGCSLSAAVAAALALGYPIQDALVLAKTYVHRAIRLADPHPSGVGFLYHNQFPDEALAPEDLPWITKEPSGRGREAITFPACNEKPLELYPIVDRASALKALLLLGISMIQLRVKDLCGYALEKEVQEAINIARRLGCRLFINDFWDLAIKHGAYGVHLGQEDLDTADLDAIFRSGIRLGISTHSLSELSRARAIQPSYYALGPIYETKCKSMRFAPQGAGAVRLWRKLIQQPLVAIGGMTVERANEILSAGADGIAVISDLENAAHPAERVRDWQRLVQPFGIRAKP